MVGEANQMGNLSSTLNERFDLMRLQERKKELITNITRLQKQLAIVRAEIDRRLGHE